MLERLVACYSWWPDTSRLWNSFFVIRPFLPHAPVSLVSGSFCAKLSKRFAFELLILSFSSFLPPSFGLLYCTLFPPVSASFLHLSPHEPGLLFPYHWRPNSRAFFSPCYRSGLSRLIEGFVLIIFMHKLSTFPFCAARLIPSSILFWAFEPFAFFSWTISSCPQIYYTTFFAVGGVCFHTGVVSLCPSSFFFLVAPSLAFWTISNL